MTSLTSCIQKAGDLLQAKDKAAILRLAREHRTGGMSALEAGRAALAEQQAGVAAQLEEMEAAARAQQADTKLSAERPQIDTEAFKGWYGDWSKESQDGANTDRSEGVRGSGSAGQRAAVDGRGNPDVDAVQRRENLASNPDLPTQVGGITFSGAAGPVDQAGQPVVFYHGTRDDFDSFDIGHPNRKDVGWLGRGVYATSDPGEGKYYAGAKRGPGDPVVMPLYMAVRNPYIADEATKLKLRKSPQWAVDAFTDKVRARGHDGVVLAASDGTVEIMALEPSQVKSATGNNGDFDRAKDNIYRSADRTDTPEFKKWFGDSKVVDAGVRPMVVYHGTASDFSVFDADKLGTSTDHQTAKFGFFFSAAPSVADEFSGQGWQGWPLEKAFKTGANLMPAYLSISNAYEMPAPEFMRRFVRATGGAEDFIREVRDAGHDGIRIVGDKALGERMGGDEYGADAWVAFKPEQIKSATGNDGNFDSSNPDITRSVDRPVFYSQLESALKSVPDRLATMTAPQWKLWLDANAGKLGVSKDELAMSGVKEYLTTRGREKISREDLADHIESNLSEGTPLFSATRSMADIKLAGGYVLGDLMKTSKKVTWWDKTVGTPFHMAEKHPEFKRTYDALQNFIGDVSRFATRAADMAPTILPKLENMADIAKRPLSAQDTEALSDPVFQGTLIYHRDAEGNPVRTDDVGLAGLVWTREELRDMWNLNPKQIDLYREFRNSVNKSLNDLGITDMVRYAGKDGLAVRGQMLEAGTAKRASEILADHLSVLASEDPERGDLLTNTAAAIKEKAGMVQGLIAKGYAPLSRFGDFTVYVTKNDGAEQVYFGMFETEREANKMARAMKIDHPDGNVTTGTMSKESYKLFSGVTPETLALFGEALGLEESSNSQQSQVFQAYLKAAKTSRSAMKRMIERKGINGYSEDVGRVLAGFVYSNGRQASTNLHAGELTKSAADIKEGDLKDAAIKLVDYFQTPQDEANALRGLLFVNFIGGSIASAMVNLTQSATTTWPVLSQHFGVGKASSAMADALKVATKGAGADIDLASAMRRAEENGVTAPQETHQLQAQASGKGSLSAGDGTTAGDALAKAGNFKNKVMLVWGKAFGWAEQMNRKIAFAAAYKLSRARGDGADASYDFAAKIVAETQFTSNRGNNAPWARGPVGATLFTFKKFGFAYLEGLSRMWGSGPEGKKAFALSLAVMFLLAGTGGFPFADDLDDLIDGFMQRVLNKSFSSKQAKKEFFAGILGDAGADFFEGGFSSLPGVPIDVSGRLGMGNVIPGTGLLTKKQDHSRDVAELGGAAGAFLTNIFNAAGSLTQGNVSQAAAVVAPTAIANVIKAVEMAQRGAYVDMKGRKVIDTTTSEAILKGIGFQPQSVKKVQDATGIQQQLIGLNKIRETEISDLWAKGRIEKDDDMIASAKRQLAEWNTSNPDSRITINGAQISKRVQEANMSKAQRITKTAPKEIRKSVKEELARATQ